MNPEQTATASREGVLLSVKAHPGASSPGVAGVRGGDVLVKVKSPPDRGKANAELVALLAEFFEMKKADVEITSGAGSRKKRVLLRGASLEKTEKIISGMSRLG